MITVKMDFVYKPFQGAGLPIKEEYNFLDASHSFVHTVIFDRQTVTFVNNNKLTEFDITVNALDVENMKVFNSLIKTIQFGITNADRSFVLHVYRSHEDDPTGPNASGKGSKLFELKLEEEMEDGICIPANFRDSNTDELNLKATYYDYNVRQYISDEIK